MSDEEWEKLFNRVYAYARKATGGCDFVEASSVANSAFKELLLKHQDLSTEDGDSIWGLVRPVVCNKALNRRRDFYRDAKLREALDLDDFEVALAPDDLLEPLLREAGHLVDFMEEAIQEAPLSPDEKSVASGMLRRVKDEDLSEATGLSKGSLHRAKGHVIEKLRRYIEERLREKG